MIQYGWLTTHLAILSRIESKSDRGGLGFLSLTRGSPRLYKTIVTWDSSARLIACWCTDLGMPFQFSFIGHCFKAWGCKWYSTLDVLPDRRRMHTYIVIYVDACMYACALTCLHLMSPVLCGILRLEPVLCEDLSQSRVSVLVSSWLRWKPFEAIFRWKILWKMHMYVCMYVYIYMRIRAYVYIFTHHNMWLNKFIQKRTGVCIPETVFKVWDIIWLSMHSFMHICVCMHAHWFVHTSWVL